MKRVSVLFCSVCCMRVWTLYMKVDMYLLIKDKPLVGKQLIGRLGRQTSG